MSHDRMAGGFSKYACPVVITFSKYTFFIA